MNKKTIELLVKYMGEFKQRKEWLNFRCPFHYGSKYNFGVNTGTGVCVCLACGEKTNLNALIGYLRRGGFSPSEGGIGLLARGRYSESNSKRLNETPVKTRSVGCDRYTDLEYTSILDCNASILKEKCLKYLYGRGVDPEKYEVGMSDLYPGRVIFPFIMNGKVVYFQGRSFTGVGPTKTVNPPDNEFWSGKTKVLWNFDKISDSDTICIGEGIFDAISIEKATQIPSTCILGSLISTHQINLLRGIGVKSVVLFLDADAQDVVSKNSVLLKSRGIRVYAVSWDSVVSGKDPGEIHDHEIKKMVFESKIVHDDGITGIIQSL